MKTFKIILIASVLAFTIHANAQDSPARFGIKGGVNLSDFSGDLKDTESRLGFNVGITLDYAFTSDIYLMTGLELTTKGVKAEFSKSEQVTDLVTEKTIVKMSPMYLQLPVHVGYKLNIADNTKLVFHAGPYMAYGIGGKAKYEVRTTSSEGISDESYKENFFGKNGAAKRFDFGLGLGVGVEFGKIGVGLGHDFGLLNIAKNYKGSEGTNLKMRNTNGYLTVGYKF